MEGELPPDIGSTKDLGNRVLHYLGDYQLLEEVGRGGMGVVYRARQVSLDRQVAVKMILHGHLASEDQLHRFQMEAATTAQLRHPNIVEVFEVGEDQGQAYFAMEFIPGVTLGDRVRSGPLPPRECAAYLTVVARAVQHAHDLGVLHRDLKPSNILLDQDGRARVTDFGLSKRLGGPIDITLSGQTFGTPAYIPPEQVAARRGAVTVRSDVYSLGSILYHLLTGRPPFHGAGEAETLRAVLEEEPLAPRTINPGIPRDLETICQRCMAKEPARRYGSAAALADDLDRWMDGLPIEARPARAPERLWLWARRRPAIALLSTLCVLAVVFGTAGILWEWRLATHHQRSAEARGEVLLKTSVELRARQAEFAFKAGRSQEALSQLAAAIRMAPNQTQPAWRLVSALNQRGFAHPTGPMLEDGTRAMQANFTPDGQRVVSLNVEHELRLWDAEGGRPLCEPMRHPGNVDAFEFSGIGSNIVTLVRGDSVFVWSSRSGGLVRRLNLGPALSAAGANPSNQSIVVGLTNGHIVALDALAPGPGRDWLAHTGAVSWVQFSADGRRFATSDSASQVRIWSADPPNALLAEVPLNGEPFDHAHFSPDGSHLFTTDGRSVARCWSLFPVALSISNNLPATCTITAWSPDGTRVLAGLANGWVIVFDPKSGRQILSYTNHLQTFMAESIFALDVSPDSRLVVSGSDDQTAHIWDLHTGQRHFEPIHEDSSVSDARFHPDGQRLLTVEVHRGIRLRRLSPPADSPQRIVEPSGVRTVAFTQAASTNVDELLLTVLTNGSVRLLDPLRGGLVREIRGPGATLEYSAIDPGARRLALADTNHHVTLIDLESFHGTAMETPGASRVAWIDFSRDQSQLAVAAGHCVYSFDASTGRLLAGPLCCDTNHILYGHRFFRVRFSPDGKRLMAPCHDLHVRVWELPSGRLLGDLPHGSSVYSAEFSPDNRFILTTSGDRRASVWSVTNFLAPIRQFRAAAPLVDGHFSADGRTAVVSGTDGNAFIWDVETGGRLGDPLTHKSWIHAVQFDPSGTRVLTRSWDGTFRVWQAPTGLALGEARDLGAKPVSIAPNQDWNLFAACTGGPEVTLWKEWLLPVPAPDWLPELAEAIAGRRIGPDQAEQRVSADALRALQQRLAVLSATNDWNRWVRWYLAGSDQPRPHP
jgi:WD40 repeat protein